MEGLAEDADEFDGASGIVGHDTCDVSGDEEPGDEVAGVDRGVDVAEPSRGALSGPGCAELAGTLAPLR